MYILTREKLFKYMRHKVLAKKVILPILSAGIVAHVSF